MSSPNPSSGTLDVAPAAVVAIVASLGGLRAVSEIVSGLPADFEAATVIVLHASEGGRGLLPRILRPLTPLPVREPKDGERLRAGCIYTAVPGQDLLVEGRGTVRLSNAGTRKRPTPSGDALFRSLAAQGELRTIAVVLTGRDGDGSEGIKPLAAAGAVVLAEDPATAVCADMPLHAIATGVVDYVLPVPSIAPRLAELVKATRP